MRGSWRQNRTATYWLPLLWPSVFLSRFPGLLNRGPTLLGAGFLYCILSPTDWASCVLSYIIVQCPPSSCGHHKSHSFNPSTVKVIFWYSSTGCTCYLHRCISYFDSPAGSEVNIQQNFHVKIQLTYRTTHIYPVRLRATWIGLKNKKTLYVWGSFQKQKSLKNAKQIFFQNFFHKYKLWILWDWFITKIILILPKYLFWGSLEEWKIKQIFQGWTEACHQIFCSWDGQTKWNLQKNEWYVWRDVCFNGKNVYKWIKYGFALQTWVEKTIYGVSTHSRGQEKVLCAFGQ